MRVTAPRHPAPSLTLSSWAVSSLAMFAAATAIAAGFDGFAGILGGAATAAVMLTVVILAVRSIAGLMPRREGHRALGLTLLARTLRLGVSRQGDPDAAGRPRSRAPAAHLLAV